jgi:FtsP/CotA-like multicopper oxidase with cupredoxin domain
MSAATAAMMAVPRPAPGLASSTVRPFRVPLRIPPVMQPVRREAERDYYEVAMRRAHVEILPGKKTTIWGFDGTFPGPTFKVRRGREVVVRRINRLNAATTTHLHGGKVPWRSDGHPSLAIEPGEAYDFVYPNDQEAATLWYHDHLCMETSRNNYMGLSGLYILEDDAEDELNLPSGRYDVPLVLQDRSFRRDGSLRFTDEVNALDGDVYLVNGRPMPYFKVANRKYRFRVLNASHSRGYVLALDTGDALTQIGSDQGLLAMATPAQTIPLWPAERAEIVVDFSAYAVGSKVVLQDETDGAEPRPIIRFDVVREESDDSEVPAVLRSIERLLPGPTTVQRELVLNKDLDTNKWVINGKPFDAGRIDIKPRLGDTEMWTFVNESSTTHPMHIHLVRFQVLDRSNGQVSAGELGWKDTVRVDPSSRVRVIMRLEGYTGRYMFHCHNLAHEDHSMMGQMLVQPAAGARAVPTAFDGGYARGDERASARFKCELTS